MLGRERLRELLKDTLASCDEGEAEGLVMAGTETVTRFAMNRVHQNVSEKDVRASFRVAKGKRVGGARTNGLDEARLKECLRRASGIASVQTEDSRFPGLAASPEATDRGLSDYDEPTASLSPEERARAALPAIEQAREAGLEASGALTVSADELAVLNSLGTFQYHASTEARLHVVARKGAVEGAWTETAGRWEEIDPVRVGSQAVERCASAIHPVRVEPGEWTVVLEPDAVADMVEMLGYMGLGALSFLEGRSFMTGRLGDTVCSDAVTLVDDPFAPHGPARPFDFEGVPKKRLVIIESGIARTPVYDRRTAARAGVESTGHALPEPNTFGPYPMNLVLEPGTFTLEEMIASTEKGILVSRFHYTNPVDPRRTIITGMTRFGTWLIEDGKVTRPVRSMRFTDSVLDALSRVEAVGGELRRVDDTLVPALKLASWRFTGVTGE